MFIKNNANNMFIKLSLFKYASTSVHIIIFARETLRDVIQLLRNTANPQVEYITRTMKKWAKDNRIPIS